VDWRWSGLQEFTAGSFQILTLPVPNECEAAPCCVVTEHSHSAPLQESDDRDPLSAQTHSISDQQAFGFAVEHAGSKPIPCSSFTHFSDKFYFAVMSRRVLRAIRTILGLSQTTSESGGQFLLMRDLHFHKHLAVFDLISGRYVGPGPDADYMGFQQYADAYVAAFGRVQGDDTSSSLFGCMTDNMLGEWKVEMSWFPP
jgi:hypothetical protein